MQIPITWKNMFERRMDAFLFFPWSATACALAANSKTERRGFLRIGRDESGVRSSERAHTRGRQERYPWDWFYRSTKYDVHARRRRYINNVNYIPPAWVTVFCTLSPPLVLFSAYKSNYPTTYLSEGTYEGTSLGYSLGEKLGEISRRKGLDLILEILNLKLYIVLNLNIVNFKFTSSILL